MVGEMIINQPQIDWIIALAKEYGATQLYLFGSTVTHPETARDLDLAYDGIEFWEALGFAGKIERELKTTVDIVELSPPSYFTETIKRRGKKLI